jgi:hypothetical protein
MNRLDKAIPYDNLNDYERGYIDALFIYAHWKDGVQYVGSTGSTLYDAVVRFLTDRGHKVAA